MERIGLDLPVVQAGMGGGLATHRLAAPVSDAGGLGTIGFLGADDLREELSAARRLTGRPVSVNLLLPFARRAHFEAAAEADVLVTFWGSPKRRGPGVWIHQVGSVEEARAAKQAGADAVIAQGVEAGGHVRGTQPLVHVLEEVLAAVDIPVVAAGGSGRPRRCARRSTEAPTRSGSAPASSPPPSPTPIPSMSTRSSTRPATTPW
jgi:nitronate monooxygenase